MSAARRYAERERRGEASLRDALRAAAAEQLVLTPTHRGSRSSGDACGEPRLPALPARARCAAAARGGYAWVRRRPGATPCAFRARPCWPASSQAARAGRATSLRNRGALALTALAVALARPHATVAVPVERASVVLVTDVSRSMRATDVEPTRLDAARGRPRRSSSGCRTSCEWARWRSRAPRIPCFLRPTTATGFGCTWRPRRGRKHRDR